MPRRRLADDLRAAIDRSEIELRYQPQVASADGRITGVEVLARWRHPLLGELGAERLFAAAGRARLLPALSQHIQGAALAEVAAWPASLRKLHVAINVTASDLARQDFAADLLARAATFGIDTARLTLEITEHEPIVDLGSAAQVLERLRATGASVALDDFGTGYCGIAYLRSLPLDYVKIDGELSADLLRGPREQVVIRHVIAMARELDLGVIAEGVETAGHRDLLAQAGATHFQGFLYAPPLDSGRLATLINNAP
ncbi:MAG: diguanylate cyclase [Sphingomonas bacterium]|uniref:EAL domain-containing protein n=1 Tax=Sphingomonas bacterium TaxID=1895847 RepID=UPI0026316C94|nr:EAL domain-containing protein [Sphingomonas bacterium]MDB5695318.1 diguanylate cyclase [Sphingomonas bacterium]